jgi:mannose-6-phosphate isomerase-like protein (cupin superfamily)
MFNKNIEDLVKQNNFFRQEVITGSHSQIVLMDVKPGEDIGEEVHTVDQTLVFVSGSGEAILNDVTENVQKGSLVFVPAGTKHNFKNTGTDSLKLYTVYAPSEHAPGTVHKTKAEAEAAEGH